MNLPDLKTMSNEQLRKYVLRCWIRTGELQLSDFLANVTPKFRVEYIRTELREIIKNEVLQRNLRFPSHKDLEFNWFGYSIES